MAERYPRIPAAVRAEMKSAGLRCPTATVAVLEDDTVRVVVRWGKTWHAATCPCWDCGSVKALLSQAVK